jgi:hypothetical protein
MRHANLALLSLKVNKAPPQTGWPLAGVAPLNLAELSLHAYPGINPCLGGGFLGFAHKSPPQNNQSYMVGLPSLLCRGVAARGHPYL